MTNIQITYNLDKDLENYDFSYINRKFPSYGRGDFDPAPYLWSNIKEKVLSLDNNDTKLGLIREYLQDYFDNNLAINLNAEALGKYWKSIESDYFNKHINIWTQMRKYRR